MKTIQLTQGKIAMVDDEDFERLNQYKWYALKSRNTYYAVQIRIGDKKIHLGYFNVMGDADSAYRIAEEKTFGEFARAV